MIKDNIARVKQRIDLACARGKRSIETVTVVAISKNRTVDEIKEVINCGFINIGENKVQEALIKYREIQINAPDMAEKIKWHLVGHLQTNKVRDAVKVFDLIQSVDSFRLALEIDKEAARINKLQEILLEVKTSSEPTKFGVAADIVIDLVKKITCLKNVSLKGLMTIAPIVDDAQKTRLYFRCLQELITQINNLRLTIYDLQLLSMGMSNDFEVAIEEGSNMVRLGRIIFT